MDELLAGIYPNRIAIGVAAASLLAILAIVGFARGWHRVALRHPRVTASAATAMLAVALPLTWYLASPLVLRSELVEADPIAVVNVASSTPEDAAPAGSQGPTGSPAAGSAAAPASAGPVSDAAAVPLRRATGSFVGADDFHFARGRARLVETTSGTFVVRLERFSVRNGPDLHVYLSPHAAGYGSGAVELGPLKATDGSFNYRVPAGTRFEDARSVVIWCKAFSVQFGVASLDG